MHLKSEMEQGKACEKEENKNFPPQMIRQSDSYMDKKVLTSYPKPNPDIQVKLKTALRHSQYITLLGTSNKMKDLEKTNGWSYTARSRYLPLGNYKKHTGLLKRSEYNKYARTNFFWHSETKSRCLEVQKWNYEDTGNINHILIQARTEKDPINDIQFALTENHKLFLQLSMLVIEKRVGNCHERSCLIAKYLWENCVNINRIEIVETTFDHVFVIVNRSGELFKSETWGDAWIIDGWYKDGLIFHATEFQEKIKEIRLFTFNQNQKLYQNKMADLLPQKTNEALKTITEIIPSKHIYPTYSISPFYPIEYYYNVINIYPKNCRFIQSYFELHQKNFAACLKEINENHLKEKKKLSKFAKLNNPSAVKQKELILINDEDKRLFDENLISEFADRLSNALVKALLNRFPKNWKILDPSAKREKYTHMKEEIIKKARHPDFYTYLGQFANMDYETKRNHTSNIANKIVNNCIDFSLLTIKWHQLKEEQQAQDNSSASNTMSL